MLRSTEPVRTKRINMARMLLNQYSSSGQVISELMSKYGVSRRQAYRYVQEDSNNRTGITCARAEDCIYSKASSQFNPSDQRQSSYNRSINQQLNYSCPGAFPQYWRGSWRINSIPERCNWNISMIVWQIRNCPRFIVFWLRITSGFSITWQPLQLIPEIK